MQPVNYGVSHQSYSYNTSGVSPQSYPPQSYPPQSYPIYPNCFDNLTTNGIIAEDVVGYITDVPSPYLQNYVAQRGWPPTMPGQILPDPLPTLPNPTPLPKGNIYPSVYPQHPDQNTLVVKKNKYETAKKVALGVLLTALTVLGVVKGRNLINKLRGNPAPTTGTPWYQGIVNGAKNLWNKIFHRGATH